MNETDEIATRLRQALHAEAGRVEPSPDALDAIQSRTVPSRRPAPARRSWVLGVAAAGLAAAATIVGVSIVANPEPATPPGDSQQLTGDQPKMARVTVYYLGLSDGRLRLFQEIRRVPAPEGREAAAAVRAALQRAPLDPDYGIPWRGIDVNSVAWQRGVIAVDLAFEAGSNAGDATWEEKMAVQQLVYTAQDALGSPKPVRFTVDGKPIDTFVGVPAAEPIERADPLEVQAMVQVTEPAEGAVVSSPVTVEGVANVFEANVNWEVLQGDQVVKHGFTMTGGAYEFSPFKETIELPPGDYTLRFFEASAEDGRPTHVDTKTITVR